MKHPSYRWLIILACLGLAGIAAGRKPSPTPSHLPIDYSSASPSAQAAAVPAAEPSSTHFDSTDAETKFILRAQEAIGDLTSNFTLTVTDPEKKTAAFKAQGKLWLASGRRYCVQYVYPERQRLVSNGTQRWLYLEKINQVQIQALPPQGDPNEFFLELGGGLPALLKHCWVKRLKEKGLRPDQRLYEFVPRAEAGWEFTRARIWLQGEQALPQRVVVEAARYIQVDFHHLTIHTTAELLKHPEQGVPNDYFTFTPPKSAEVIDMLW